MRNLRTIRQSFSMSIQNIKSNKMRSFLTMLGIVIGVASVIALITIVEGSTASILSEFSGMGAGTLSVNISGTPLKDGLNENDMISLSKVDGVKGVSPSVSINTDIVSDGVLYKKVTVEGRDETYFLNNNLKIDGRSFNSSDMSGDSKVAIIDPNLNKTVFDGKARIGSKIMLNGYTYTIVGIQGEAANSLTGQNRSSGSGTITIPWRNAIHIAGRNTVTGLNAYIEEGSDINLVSKRLEAALLKVFNQNKEAYSVMNMESLLSAIKNVTNMMAGMLGGIASISLLVGGVGIMNMMLTSVSERTKEIGLRKALGAEPFRIQLQFLIESVTLSVIGGIIGIVLGLLIAYVASILLKNEFAISPNAIAIGVGFSTAVGVIFGWAPARRASRLNPIDALRTD